MKIAINGEILEVSGGGALPEGTVAVKPIAQAEYEALTDDEKQADVVYAITDDGGSSGGGSGGTSEEVYSTEETRIGTWIDGKPLYRRVVSGVLPTSLNTSSGGNFMVYTISSIANSEVMETVTSLTGRIQHGSAPMWYPFPYVDTDSSGAVAVVMTLVNDKNTANSNKIRIAYECTNQVVLNQYTGDAYFVIIEYTKTTDTGGTT